MRRRTDLQRVNHEPRWVSHQRGYCRKAAWVACQYDTLQKYEDSKYINSKLEPSPSTSRMKTASHKSLKMKWDIKIPTEQLWDIKEVMRGTVGM